MTLTPVAKAVATALLIFVGTVSVPATNESFIAKEKFVENISASAKTKIYDLGTNFQNWFLKKVEKPFAGSVLSYKDLIKREKSTCIIQELGGEKKAETSLFEVFKLMENQPNGEKGVLLNSGHVNIFYCKDISGMLRVVNVHWCVVGWRVYARPVDGPYEWNSDDRVFSRNSATV